MALPQVQQSLEQVSTLAPLPLHQPTPTFLPMSDCLTSQFAPQLPHLSQEMTPISTRTRSGSGHCFPPGLSAPPGTPSHGSALHGVAKCRPCAWFWKESGCRNGKDCGHCHLCPDGELKERKKIKMVQMRLGLVTPVTQASNNIVDLTPFCLVQEGSCSGSELESTTCCSSPEQEMRSDEEALITSVIGCLGLEEGESVPAQKSPEALSTLTSAGMKAPPSTPSHGLLAHAAGICKPCAWYWKPSGCQNYETCNYCHTCPEGELKARKRSKNAAMRLGLVTPKANSLSASFEEARYPLNLAACL